MATFAALRCALLAPRFCSLAQRLLAVCWLAKCPMPMRRPTHPRADRPAQTKPTNLISITPPPPGAAAAGSNAKGTRRPATRPGAPRARPHQPNPVFCHPAIPRSVPTVPRPFLAFLRPVSDSAPPPVFCLFVCPLPHATTSRRRCLYCVLFVLFGFTVCVCVCVCVVSLPAHSALRPKCFVSAGRPSKRVPA